MSVSRFSYADDRILSVPLPAGKDNLQSQPVECMTTAANGDVLIMTRNKVYVVRAGTTEAVLLYTSPDVTLRYIASANDIIYFSGSDGGLHYTIDEFVTMHDVVDADGGKIFGDDNISFILPRPNGKLYVGMRRYGVGYIDPMNHSFMRLDLGEEAPSDIYVRSILQNGEEELWVGTENGLFIYNLITGSCQHLKSSYYDNEALSDNAVYSLFKDSSGGIWVGTFFGGLNYLHSDGKLISKYYPTGEPGSIMGKRVRGICPDGEGRLWVGTEDSGLYEFNPRTEEFRFFEKSRDFSNVHDIHLAEDKLWVCTFGGGVKVIDTVTGRVKSYSVEDGRSNISSDFTFSCVQAEDGRIYVGTINSLQYYDNRTDSFVLDPGIKRGSFIRDLFIDSSGCLWASSEMAGLYWKRKDDKDWHFMTHDPDDPNSIPSNNISEIFEDSRHTLWFATEGNGFFRLDDEAFKVYNTSNGIPSDVVCKILEDDRGFLWISTIGGLALFDPAKGEVLDVFTKDDGLLDNQFNNKSGFKDQSGRLWFGTNSGLISFSPNALPSRNGQYIPPIYLTDLYISDERILAGGNLSPLDMGLIETRSLKLSSKQNTISLKLASPQHIRGRSAHQIVYMMEGYDNGWRKLPPGESMVDYSKLPSGKYVFLAKTLNADKPSCSLIIKILPPWYRSVSAHVIYLILAFMSLYEILKIEERVREKKESARRHEYEIEKARELYDSKTSFYTNIAHEIRTPLTLIKAPLDKLLKSDISGEAKEDLRIMDKNSTRLLNLVDELLDFNKVESKGKRLDFTDVNVSDLISNTIYQFSSAAKQSGKTITLNLPPEPVTAVLDAEAVTKIFSNLLSNAMKYSESTIKVILERSGDSLYLRVFNDGGTIAPEYRERVFEPFFRIDENSQVSGSGVGLPYARSLARMHGGDLILEDREDETTFCVVLPCNQSSPTDATPEITRENSSEKKRCILIVEDYSDMRLFEEKILGAEYAVISARNGVEALEILQNKTVDMIVSDVMMPKMDGIELSHRVKSDFMFSHIPIVLLTAKTSTEAKIEGANVGADVYIEKPFSPEYLLSVISNIFVSRDRLMERIQKYPLSPIGNVAASDADNELITRIHDIIMDNLTNPNFSVDNIASELAMSRSSFYRKIKGVLNMNPNEYLRLERLKEAAKLINERKYSLTEISYMVGFNSLSYFSKCFQKQFGIQPKDF